MLDREANGEEEGEEEEEVVEVDGGGIGEVEEEGA